MVEITTHEIKSDKDYNDENLDEMRCVCGRKKWPEEMITMAGDNYVYILCPCDRMLRIEWDDDDYYTGFFIGEEGSATAYIESREG